MRRGQWGLREQTEIVDTVDKSAILSTTYPQYFLHEICYKIRVVESYPHIHNPYYYYYYIYHIYIIYL